MHFGLEHPEAYRIMFMGRSMLAVKHADTLDRSGGSAFTHHVAAVQRAADAGRLRPGTDVLSAAIFLWSGVHGITSLLISLASFPWPDREPLLSRHVRPAAARAHGGGTVTTTANPYLLGNFAPVADERDDDALDVTGAIPPELDGLLLRNGPNPIAPDPAAYHWFIGDGMLHGIELRERSRPLPQPLGAHRRRVRRAR